MTLRQVAAQSGCSHPLVGRYFGSKHGLEQAVVEGLADRVGVIVSEVDGGPIDRFAGLLQALRSDLTDVKLLVRCALGDLDAGPILPPLASFSEGIAQALVDEPGGGPTRVAGHSQVAVFGAMCLALGWLTLERFLVVGADLGAVPRAARDDAMAEAAGFTASLFLVPSSSVRTRGRDRSVHPPLAGAPEGEAEGHEPARRRLVEAAADLFAEKGPVASSTRELAARAGVGQRVIYRHFASKEALLSEALDAVWSPAYAAAVAPEGLDVDLVVELVRQQSRGARIIARALVDGIDVDQIRRRFPILEAGLSLFDDIPRADLSGPSDPRAAVAASVALALGSAIWEPVLRPASGIGPGAPLDRALADASRALLERAEPSRPLAPSRR